MAYCTGGRRPYMPSRIAPGKIERGHSRVTHSRNQEDTGGHERTRRRVKSSTAGHWRNRGTREDTTARRFGTVMPGFKSRAPDQVLNFETSAMALLGDAPNPPVSQLELAHRRQVADIPADARPQHREAPGFENQRRCPRRCAASAQVRSVNCWPLGTRLRANGPTQGRPWTGRRARASSNDVLVMDAIAHDQPRYS